MNIRPAKLGPVTVGDGKLCLVAGPCVLEDETMALRTAETIRDICLKLNIPYVFKSSFDKANRTSPDAYRGPGIDQGLRMLRNIHDKIGVPICTDVHEAAQVDTVAQVADVLQIPAFLCRQTDLVRAAAATGRALNIKKGQFVQPDAMKYVIAKAVEAGCQTPVLTERGSCFGYGDLVVDMRSFDVMHGFDVPVLMDATHSVQKPGSGGNSGGDRRFAGPLALAAVAAGADGLFLEVHPDPDSALCDGPNMLILDKLEEFLTGCLRVYEAVHAP